MKARDWAQQVIYKIIDRPVRGLIKIGVTPNVVTTVGLLFNILGACIFIYAGMSGERGDFSYIGWGGFVILFAGLFDMLDGQVARIGKMSSTFGALYDSVLDRYSELITLSGICYYLMLHNYHISSIIGFVALIGSIMVSYVRARAEGLGIECKVGFMQRPERVVLLGIGGILTGVFYSFMPGDERVMFFFLIALSVIAVFSNITAFGRLNHCRKVLNKKEEA